MSLANPPESDESLLRASGLTAAAIERLRPGIELCVETFLVGDDDSCTGPEFLLVSLNIPVMALIQRRRDMCSNGDICMIETFMEPDDYGGFDEDDADSIRISHWNLRIGASTFWFRGTPKYGNTSVESRIMEFKRLASLLDGDEEAQTMPFRWIGNVIAYSASGTVDVLAESLLDHRPELRAQIVAQEMSEVIDGAGVALAADEDAPRRRSRAGI